MRVRAINKGKRPASTYREWQLQLAEEAWRRWPNPRCLMESTVLRS